MKLSQKTIYSLKMLIMITLSKELTTVKQLADKLEISYKYSEQLTQLLQKTGYISSRRGVDGGFFLVEEPERIGIVDLLDYLENGLISYDNKCNSSIDYAIINTLVIPSREFIFDKFAKITLKDLIESYENSQNFTYII